MAEHWKLATSYTLTDLDLITEKLLSIDDILNQSISLGTAIGKSFGGQGYATCHCRITCLVKRCSCFRNNMKCISSATLDVLIKIKKEHVNIFFFTFFLYTFTKSWKGYILLQFVCVSVCPTLLVNKIPVERMHRFGCSFR